MALSVGRLGAVPSVLVLALLLAACETSSKDGRGVTETAVEASKPVSDTVVALEHMGDRAVERGEYGSAIMLYGQALRDSYPNPTVATKLGEALYQENRNDEALEIYRSVLDSNPSHIEATLGFAKSQLALDRPAIAADQLERTLQRNEDDARLWTALGVARDLQGNHGRALEAYERALALDPGDLSARNNRALSLALNNRLDESIKELERINETTDANARSRQNLALVYALAGDLSRAERLSYIDLNDDAVRNNLAYFASLDASNPDTRRIFTSEPAPSRTPVQEPLSTPPAAIEPNKTTSEKQSSVVEKEQESVQSASETDDDSPSKKVARKKIQAPSDTPPPPPPDILTALEKLTASLENGPLEEKNPATMTTPSVSDNQALSKPARTSVEHNNGTIETLGLALANSPEELWVLELGNFADEVERREAWQSLRKSHGEILVGISRFGSTGEGNRPLLAGPIAQRHQAQEICAELQSDSRECAVMGL